MHADILNKIMSYEIFHFFQDSLHIFNLEFRKILVVSVHIPNLRSGVTIFVHLLVYDSY